MLSSHSVDAPSNQLQILAYLDRVKKLYPYGVSSASLIRSPGASVSVSQTAALLFVCDEKRSEHDALIGAICSKGLQLTPNEYSVHHIEDQDILEVHVADLIKERAPIVALVFGSESKRGAVEVIGSTRVLFVQPLKSISSDLAVKKAFWKLLQESVVPLLEAR
jgi:hypothetical protein